MASPALLFLLLMSSSLLLSTMSVSRPSSPNQQVVETKEKINKFKEGAKATGKFILKNFDQIRLAVTPFLALVPVCTPLITAISVLAMIGGSVINNSFKEDAVLIALKEEFENLNFKIDQYHVEQKWDTWASGAYHKPELKIKVAWDMYEKLVPSLIKAKSDDERKKFREEMIKVCEKSAPATTTLYQYLTAKGTTLIKNLGDLLAEHVKCHEKDIREYTVFINKLIYMGNTLNQLCYKLKNIETKDLLNKDDKIAYGSASVMFHTHMNCVLDSLKYAETDVKGLIDKNVKREELAKTIRAFLDKTYDRWDWMVVAFLTKNSEHKIIETLNKHILSGFTPVPRGKVTVAVARQKKGAHTMAGQVKDAIRVCISDKVLCYKVAEELSKCTQSVSVGSKRVPVTQAYTAVHAFTRKAHASLSKEEEETVYADPADDSVPYIYQGKCRESPGVKRGKFVVMIKSDEEIKDQDPCHKRICGGSDRGKCVRVKDSFVAMCDCKQPYFGENCENNLNTYRDDLEKKIRPAVVDNRRRNVVIGRPGI